MLRKTTSELGDGKPSLLSEFKREFGWVADGLVVWKNHMVASYPKQIFMSMVVLIVISFILRFTVLAPDKADGGRVAPVVEPAFEALSQPATDIQKKMALLEAATDLRSRIQAVLMKERLSQEDSLYILKASQKLKIMENEINQF